MATIPHSIARTKRIKEKATESFEAAMKAAKKEIDQDPLLHELILISMAGEQQTRQAMQLHALNPKWCKNYYSSITIIYAGIGFAIAIKDRPAPLDAGEDLIIDLDKDPDTRPQVNARFLELYRNYERAANDRKALEYAIDNIVEATANIQRAVEVMPAILNWLTDEDRAKYYEPNPKYSKKRASAEEIQASTFTPEMLAAMARARMSKP